MATDFTYYAISEGGLLRSLERKLHITRGNERDWIRRTRAFVVIAYVPMLVAGVVWRIVAGEWLPGLASIDSHVRALVTVPLLLAAEPFVERRTYLAGRYFHDSGIVGSGPTAEVYRSEVERTAHLRDSHIIELALLLFVLGSLLSRALFDAAPLAWSTVPTITVFQFLLLRWIWRWALWAVFLWRLSRLPLGLRATHPDRLGGLAPLLGPAYAFSMVAAAGSSMLAGIWADQIVHEGVSLIAHRHTALAYIFVVVLLAVFPTTVFLPVLAQVRRQELERYGAFAQRYVRAFAVRWHDADGESALGAPDLQSLADLGQSYTVVVETKVLPIQPHLAMAVVAWSLVPIVPLAVHEVGLLELIQSLGKMLL